MLKFNTSVHTILLMVCDKKQKTVTLVTPSGVKQQFGIQHAERLLGLGPSLNGGWTIDPNSDYYYDEENSEKPKEPYIQKARVVSTIVFFLE